MNNGYGSTVCANVVDKETEEFQFKQGEWMYRLSEIEDGGCGRRCFIEKGIVGFREYDGRRICCLLCLCSMAGFVGLVKRSRIEYWAVPEQVIQPASQAGRVLRLS